MPNVILRCDHSRMFLSNTPKLGDRIYCYSCDDMRIVVKWGDEYHIRCEQCRYSRRFGQDNFSANVFAAKHMATRRHTIGVWFGQKNLRNVAPDLAPDLFGAVPF
jgi:hypothetical protein